MKKILMAIALWGVCSLVSCESYFDVNLNSQPTLEDVFSKYNTTKRYLNQLYSHIPLEESIVDSHGWVVPRSDEATFSWTAWVNYITYKTGNYGISTPQNAATFNFWKGFYVGINQCTVFLNNFNGDDPDNQDLKRYPDVVYMDDEARFLRAYYYFCLFRQYGPVFLWFDQTPDMGIIGANVDRHTVEENIDFIVSELDKAATGLPDTRAGVSSGAHMGRATKGAALALKARVLLYAASPLYNGCDLYKGQMKNMRGDYLFPQTADPAKWDAAATAALAVINMNRYDLYENTTETDPYKKAAASYQGVMLEWWNEETIWGWWFRPSSAYSSYGSLGGVFPPSLPPGMGGKGIAYGFGGIAPSLKLVDSYPMMESGRYPVKGYQGQNDLSRPIVDELSGYQTTGFTENYLQPLVSDWAAPIKAHNTTVGRDPRFYASLVPNGFWWPNSKLNNGSPVLFTCYNSVDCASPYGTTGDHLLVGYAWRRMVKPEQSWAPGDDYALLKYVYPAFRMAEIYLNYAEACNEKPQRDGATAVQYLNKTRNRVGLNNIEEAYPGIENDQALLRWCIQKERMVEFGMEAMRHYDACRWMIAKTEYPGRNWTLALDATNYEDSYNRTSAIHPVAPSVFTDRDYLFPISSVQTAEMVNITQNYGF